MCAKPRRRPVSRRSSGSCSPVDVDSTETAVAVIGYYLRRWRIEDLFRVSSPDAESNISVPTVQRAVTINTVIAWRLMVMTLLGRDVPGCDAQLLFTDIELRFLTDYAEELGLPPPDHLAAAVLLLAIFGGYQNRTHDPPPGHQIMWPVTNECPSQPSATALDGGSVLELSRTNNVGTG